MKGLFKALIKWFDGRDLSEPEFPSCLFSRKDVVVRLSGRSIVRSNSVLFPLSFWEPIPFFSRKKKVVRFGFMVNMAPEIFETFDANEAVQLYHQWKEKNE